MTHPTANHSFKRRLLIGGAIAALPILMIGVVVYLFLAPKYVDGDLFAYIKQPYEKQNVVYSYSTSGDYGLAFARITPAQAKRVVDGPSTIFPECQSKSANERDCTGAWVSNSDKDPDLTIGMQRGDELKAAQDAFAKTMTKESFCTYAPDPFAISGVVVRHKLCVNPVNGYVMYTYLNP